MKISLTKTLFSLYLSLNSLIIPISAQTFEYLDINNISTRFNAAGDLFWDYYSAKFEVPKGGGINAILAGNIWIGGLDANGQLHIAANTYRTIGSDFWAGPVAISYGAAYDNKYKRVWKVSKDTILYHINHFMDAGYIVPASINDWPANPNPALGIDSVLAPFVDVNGNKIYDPENGDYPKIRGDETVYFIINDDRHQHTETGGLKLGIEVQAMAYAYDTPSNKAINNF